MNATIQEQCISGEFIYTYWVRVTSICNASYDNKKTLVQAPKLWAGKMLASLRKDVF